MKHIIGLIIASAVLASCATSPRFTSLNDITPPTSDQDRSAKCRWIALEIKKQQDFNLQNGGMQGLTAVAIENRPRQLSLLNAKAAEIGCSR